MWFQRSQVGNPGRTQARLEKGQKMCRAEAIQTVVVY